MAYFDLDPLLGSMLDVAPGISDLNLSVGRRRRSRWTGSSARWRSPASSA